MSSETDDIRRDDRRLWVLAVALIVATAIVAWLSLSFGSSTEKQDRPVAAVLVVWLFAGVAYLLAVRVGIRLPDRSKTVWTVVGVSVLLRAILVLTTPILEIDLYRYVWDGNAAEAGVSPFRYSPDEVRFANAFGTTDPELQRLIEKVQAADSLDVVLETVHFGHLRTPYPPVSQAVFWASAVLTPDRAPVGAHVVTMKTLLVLFDLATLAVMLSLLRRTGLPIGWAIAYGWCPLVLKEFANSGHLDAIAVFFTALTVWLVTPSKRIKAGDAEVALAVSISRWRWLLSAVSLAAAVAAKIYPLVLAPLLLVHALRSRGRRVALACVALCIATTSLLFSPMLLAERSEFAGDDAFNLPAPEFDDDGLKAFVEEWEINDLLFAVVVENVKTRDTLGDQPEPWFSVVPQTWRTRLLDSVRTLVDRGESQAFFVSRLFVAVVYAMISLWLAVRLWRGHSTAIWLESVFLAIAWLWLLAPTQNPWYWTWALAFVPFARSRAWLLLGVLALGYYGRFWCEYHAPGLTFGDTHYRGVYLFDLVLVWLEYLPFWAILIGDCVLRRKQMRTDL